MDKQAKTSINRIGFGSLLGVSGFIVMSFGVTLNNVWLIRGGIAMIIFATWLIAWQ